jgi:hypothetical protein
VAVLSNKRIVVTGGSAGLGLAIAKALREAQADVTVVARDEGRLEAARETGAHAIAGDATDAVLMDRVIAHRDPDVLILNAGARLPMARIDELSWEGFSTAWDTDVRATLIGIQAALRTPMRPGTRVMVMSSGAAMVMSHPAISPDDLRLSGGYVGAKRMIWFMAHQADAVSRERGLGIRFQALVPGQLVGATELGRTVARAYAEIEGVTVDEHILRKYGSHLQPAQIGRQVVELLSEPEYENGIAYGFRAEAPILPLDVQGPR